MNDWTIPELRHVDLGDRRLNRRLLRLVEALAARPQASVPEATGSWAAAKAAYRFWDNDRVHPAAIHAAHRTSTLGRLPADGPLLAIQDSTALDFTPHPATRGLGYLGHPQHHGLWLHSVLCASADGVPLGLLAQQAWARDPTQLGKRKHRRRKETRDKESQRWLTALAATADALPAGRTVITVADREADFYDLFAAPRRPGLELLVRARGRRRVRHEAGLLGTALRASPVRGHLTVTLPRGDGRPERVATLGVRFGTFRVEPPATHPRRRELTPLPLQAVWVEEAGPPAGQEPVRWLLLTTLPLPDFAAAAQAVRWYTVRWLIERYHYVLKSGCRVEQLQLETAARLGRALATYAVVAWRLLWLTYEARQRPEQSCGDVLRAEEWQVLHQHLHPGAARPNDPPSLRAAVRQIARLGGFLARRGDGEPGVKTLWRGLRRLEDLVTGWQLASQHLTPAVVGNA
jgi:hypothetical protein